jgi:hypothetical protein
MGEGMCAALDGDVYPDAESAAHAAFNTAEYAAEEMRDAEAQGEDEEQ